MFPGSGFTGAALSIAREQQCLRMFCLPA